MSSSPFFVESSSRRSERTVLLEKLVILSKKITSFRRRL